MQHQSDAQWIRDYAAHGSDPAFAGIVARHTDLVYSAALRQTGSPELAREIAQSVFTDLARKAPELAGRLAPEASLAGWLYRGTRFATLSRLRDERRRASHERQFMEHFHPAAGATHSRAAEPTAESAPDWQQVAPVLDEAMAELGDADREAVVLRYFQNQDFQAVARALGVSEAAAQKRVSRAVERLRESLAQRGVTAGAQGLVVLIAAQAVLVAPAGLSAALATAALAGTTLITAATATVGKAIAMTTTQKVLVAAVLAAAVGAGIYETNQVSTLQTEVQNLRQQSIQPAGQIQQLIKNRDDVLRQLAALRADNERLSRDSADLLKLRGEVTLLRADAKELAGIKKGLLQNTNERLPFIAMMWVKDTKELRERLAQMPQLNIPELGLLDDFAWLRLADSFGDINDDDDVREVFRAARLKAKELFAHYLRAALLKYAEANDGQIPKQLLDLKPFFRIPGGRPLDEPILKRYELVQAGKLSDAPSHALIVEKAPVVDTDDTVFQIGPGGYTSYHITPKGTELEKRNFMPAVK